MIEITLRRVYKNRRLDDYFMFFSSNDEQLPRLIELDSGSRDKNTVFERAKRWQKFFENAKIIVED